MKETATKGRSRAERSRRAAVAKGDGELGNLAQRRPNLERQSLAFKALVVGLELVDVLIWVALDCVLGRDSVRLQRRVEYRRRESAGGKRR